MWQKVVKKGPTPVESIDFADVVNIERTEAATFDRKYVLCVRTAKDVLHLSLNSDIELDTWLQVRPGLEGLCLELDPFLWLTRPFASFACAIDADAADAVTCSGVRRQSRVPRGRLQEKRLDLLPYVASRCGATLAPLPLTTPAPWLSVLLGDHLALATPCSKAHVSCAVGSSTDIMSEAEACHQVRVLCVYVRL